MGFLYYLPFHKGVICPSTQGFPFVYVFPKEDAYIECLATKWILYYLSFHKGTPILSVFPHSDSYITRLSTKGFLHYMSLAQKVFLNYMSFHERIPILSFCPRKGSWNICLSKTWVPFLSVFPQMDSYNVFLSTKGFIFCLSARKGILYCPRYKIATHAKVQECSRPLLLFLVFLSIGKVEKQRGLTFPPPLLSSSLSFPFLEK